MFKLPEVEAFLYVYKVEKTLIRKCCLGAIMAHFPKNINESKNLTCITLSGIQVRKTIVRMFNFQNLRVEYAGKV